MTDPAEPDERDEATAYLERLPRAMVQNAMRILEAEGGVEQVDSSHYSVLSLRTASRRVVVYRRGDVWRCRSDKHNNQDRPCGHILAVLMARGDVERPNTAASVDRKSNRPRNHALEERAWVESAVRLPEYLARLLREALPVIAPEPPLDPRGGRPRASTHALVYQAVMRVAHRQNLRFTVGAMRLPHHREHNPDGAVSRSTLSAFLKDPETTTLLEKLLALSTWPAAPYETLVHPDGTGFTEERFTQFFEEKRRLQEEAAAREAKRHGKPAPKVEPPREHDWTYAEILWSYRYTLIGAMYAQSGPFGEAPWMLPLVERARIFLAIRELGADKAYNAYYIDEYLARLGIESQVIPKENAALVNSNAHRRAYKARIRASRIDPEGFMARAHRRENAEAGNHALKAFLGDQIYSQVSKRDPGGVAQRNELLCMALAYNLNRLILLGLDQGIEIQFAPGVDLLARQPWESLEDLHRRLLVTRSKTRRLAS